MDNLKSYIILPCLALLMTAAIYLSLTIALTKYLSVSPLNQELLWQHVVAKNIIISDDNQRATKLENMVNNLPTHLLPQNSQKVTIIVTKDDELNAFAAPGNKIIITTGLLDSVKNDAALIFVLGHEIGHLTRQDHLYELSRYLVSKTYGFISLSRLLEEGLRLVDNSKIKENEFLADQWALKIFFHYYSNLSELNELLKTLSSKENKMITSPLIMTHPTIQDRLKRLNLLIGSYI